MDRAEFFVVGIDEIEAQRNLVKGNIFFHFDDAANSIPAKDLSTRIFNISLNLEV